MVFDGRVEVARHERSSVRGSATLLHRHLGAVDVVDGLTAALGVGAVRADVVAVEARRIADQRPTERTSSSLAATELSPARMPAARLASLTERRLADPTAVIAGLPPDARPAPTVTAYDELLTRRRTPPTTATPAVRASSEGQVS